jgi:cob(I)alamin adenosyltransferase
MKGKTDVVYMVNRIRDDSRLNWGGNLADEMHSYINHYKQSENNLNQVALTLLKNSLQVLCLKFHM